MAMKKFSYPYGKTHKEFEIPEEQILAEIKIKKMPVLPDVKAAVLEAIRNPINSKPLREIVQPGQTVAFIANDPTRVARTYAFLPILVEELNSIGVPDEDMCVVFALGTHRNMSYEEMVEAIGEDLAGRLKMYNSNAKEDTFIEVGRTSRGTRVAFNEKVMKADHIICTGSIVHHFFAGFGGGRKAMFPGVAAHDTIRHNHSLMLQEGAVIGKLDGNPVSEDQVEGVSMHPPSFLINAVLDDEKNFLRFYAGHWYDAWREACVFVDEVYGVPIEQEADIVIATCGGYPKDINIYQAQKTMDNAWCAVRQGGVVIMVAECIEGSGSATFENTMDTYKTPAGVAEHVRHNFEIGIHKAFAVSRLTNKATFIFVSSLDKELAEKALFVPAGCVQEAIEKAKQILNKENPDIILMPQGGLTVPILKK